MTSPDDQPVPRDTRQPPHDLAAEMCVLGAMLLSKDAIADVVERVRSGDFYAVKHGWIYDTIIDLYGRGEPADPVTVLAALTAKGHKVGGGPYMHDLVSSVPTAANGSYYATIVAKLAVQRRLGEAATRIVQQSYNPNGVDVDDLVDQAQQAMYDLTAHGPAQGYSLLGDLLQSTIDEVEAIGSRGGDGPTGVPSGVVDLDRILLGAHPGQLIVVAGRPGMGKSTFALDWARNAAIRHNLPAAFFSLEMPATELVMRVLSAEARVPLAFVRSGQLSDDHWAALARRAGEVSEAAMFVDDTANMTLMEIRAKSRRMDQQLRGPDPANPRPGLKLVVVDYLQLMTAPSGRKTPDRQQEVADISRGLKLLAKELMCPVIAVAQLNREADKRADKRPQLSDLRESGSIENDADVVILVHRDDYYDKESPRAGEADLIIAKHRNGPTDTITVAAQLHLSRFADLSTGGF